MLLTWGCSNSSNSLSSLKGTRWVGKYEMDGTPTQNAVLFFITESAGESFQSNLDGSNARNFTFSYILDKDVLRIQNTAGRVEGNWIIKKMTSSQIILSQKYTTYEITARLERDEPMKD